MPGDTERQERATEALRAGFELGDWQVLPERNLLLRGDEEAHLERLAMDVLVVLASRQGELVTKDDLVNLVWDGRPQMDDVITQKISLTRKALGDMSRPHRYIETIFGRGYRMKMPVTLPQAPPQAEEAPASRRAYWLALGGGLAGITVVFLTLMFKPAVTPVDEAGGPMRSVVVFPFQCSIDVDDYLCEGLRNLLTSTLSQLDDLQVVKSRTPYPENRTDVQIAEDFNVDGVIWGTVNGVDDRLEINADLVDGRSGFVEFSRIYETDVRTLVDTQEEVANDVRMFIRGEASPELRTTSRPADYAVLESFWRAEYEFAKRSRVSIYKAIGHYNETIRLDPEYGPAYLRLAYAKALLPDYSDEDRARMYQQALDIASLGVERDSSIEEAMATVYGFVHHKRFDLISAQDYFEQALAADVVMPQTHQLYSRLMASVGRLEDSLHHAHRARALDPEDVVLISRLAISHYWMNDVERAQQLFELTQDRVDVALPINGLTFALLLVGQERYDDAAQLAKTALANAGAKSDWVDTVFAGLKDPAEEESAVQLVGLMAENELLPPVIQITLWVLFGRIDEAMEIAGRLQHDGEIFEAEILFSPDFRALREHPGFLRLMDDIGVADYWDHVGCEWRDDAVHCQ